MKRKILLVDDEVAVLLTLKAVLEISGFDVTTAASARDGKARLKSSVFDMVITDMRMEEEESGREVIVAARTAPYHPAVALLTAFPVAEDNWQDMGADKMLVKPMHTRALIQSIEQLLVSHQAKLKKLALSDSPAAPAKAMAATEAKATSKPARKSGAASKGAARKSTATK